MKIKHDEYEFLIMLTENEIKTISGQLDWCKEYEPENKESIEPKEIYIKRLQFLKNKLYTQTKDGE